MSNRKLPTENTQEENASNHQTRHSHQHHEDKKHQSEVIPTEKAVHKHPAAEHHHNIKQS